MKRTLLQDFTGFASVSIDFQIHGVNIRIASLKTVLRRSGRCSKIGFLDLFITIPLHRAVIACDSLG